MCINWNFRLKKYFSTGLLTFLLSVLVVASIFISIRNMEKEIRIVIDGKETNVETYRSEVASILAGNDIILGPKDKIEPSLKSTVVDGGTISIIKAKSVQVQVDGKTINLLTAEEDVKSLLSSEGIELREEDRISLSLDDKIENGQNISITRVERSIEVQKESIEFATVIKKDYDSYEGTKKTLQEGDFGEREIKTEIVYENGKEISREVISDAVVKEPTDKIVSVGTLGKLALSRGGSLTYKNKIYMRATAYTLSYADTGKNPGDPGWGITYSGMHVKRDPNGYSTVAVDPRVIPIGTKLYVDGYGYAIAADKGSAVKGNKIDLYFTTKSQCNSFGVRNLNVYVLK
ncbi:3D domain-containing protein [Clostridium sediminicola]|uniref:3D domain-containing protein n=1 Tax=Clostridium sediminicola TaxID=3114879 RepID=UPI0031F20DA6